MAADVSHLVQILKRYKEEGEGAPKTGALVTRDLLGGCSVLGKRELDLDLKAPTGWEKRLDLVSGEVFLQSSQPQATPSTADKLQDLNLPPPPPPNLELKLFAPSSSSSTPSTFHQSVCTLDKVKSALARAAKENNNNNNNSNNSNNNSNNNNDDNNINNNNPQGKLERSLSVSPTSSFTSTTTTSTLGNKTETNKGGAETSTQEGREVPRSSRPVTGERRALMAAGCPSCLSYVLVAKDDPRCPRCCSAVPSPSKKKPRVELDLNSYTMAAFSPLPTTDCQL